MGLSQFLSMAQIIIARFWASTYRLSTVWTVVWGVGHNIISVETLRRLETHVVVAWSGILTEAELRAGTKDGRRFLLTHSNTWL